MAAEKRCYKCAEVKPISAFSLDKSRADGRQPRCKACYAAYAASRRKPRELLHPDEIKRRRQEYKDRNRQASREYAKQWMRDNKDKFAEYAKAWRKKNKEKETATRRAWCEKNAERLSEQPKAYAKNNRGRILAHARARQTRQIRATPVWANLKNIQDIYVEAARLTRELGFSHHVDHIVPLKSKWVCGLHCEANLQIIPAAENLSKSNRIWPDMWTCYEGNGTRSTGVRSTVGALS